MELVRKPTRIYWVEAQTLTQIINSSPVYLTKPFRSPDHIGPESIVKKEVWVDISPPPIVGSLSVLTSFQNTMECILGNLQFSVIVMTFWYVFGTDLTFLNFLNFYSSLGIDHDPPCSLCSHDLCSLMFHSFTRLRGQEKSQSYYDLF